MLRNAHLLLGFLWLWLGMGESPALAQTAFYLQPGDRVVFYGDSITEQRLYSTFVETFVVTRFPRLGVRFVHSGWGGDRVTGGGGGSIELRLRRDVIAYNPTVVTVMLGMNDGRYKPLDPQVFQTYTTGYQRLLDLMRTEAPRARITLLAPSPYDEVTVPTPMKGGLYNDVLIKFGAYLKTVAAQRGMAWADLNSDLVAVLRKATAADPELAKKIVPGRVHPAPAGHLIMAGSLLQAWHAPALVASIAIDGKQGRLIQANNSRVSELTRSPGLSWTELDQALPMPIDLSDPAVELAVRLSSFLKALDQAPLRVTGLAPGSYALRIDGEQVAVFSADDLDRGVNLAILPTPMVRQAAQVHALTLAHNDLHFARWRAVQLPMDDLASAPAAQVSPALDSLDTLETALIEKQRATALPRPHRFELAPVSEVAAAVPAGFTPVFGTGPLPHLLLDGRRLRSAEIYLELNNGCSHELALLLRLRPTGEAVHVSLDCGEGGSLGQVEAPGTARAPKPEWAASWTQGSWNRVRVRLDGFAAHVQIWLNGKLLTDWHDDHRHGVAGQGIEGESSGQIALQLPGGMLPPAWPIRNLAVKDVF